MKDIDTFQFHPISAHNSDGGMDILFRPSDGVEYEHELADIMISSYDVAGTEAAMLLPAVQRFQEAPAETAKGGDDDGGNGSYIHDWGLDFG